MTTDEIREGLDLARLFCLGPIEGTGLSSEQSAQAVDAVNAAMLLLGEAERSQEERHQRVGLDLIIDVGGLPDREAWSTFGGIGEALFILTHDERLTLQERDFFRHIRQFVYDQEATRNDPEWVEELHAQAKVLVEHLEGAWWIGAANAYNALKGLTR
jgi:hypothetical protein